MITSLDTQTLQQRFVQQWGAAEPGVPVFWENAPDQATPANGHWLRFAVSPGETRRAGYTRGNSIRHESRGRVEIQVFAPRGAGTGERDRLADVAATIFKEWKSADGRLECSGADFSASTPNETDAWSMRRVSIPYLSRRSF